MGDRSAGPAVRNRFCRLSACFNNSGGDEWQQDFVVPDKIEALPSPGGGSFDHIGEGAIVRDKVHVDGGKAVQAIPQVAGQADRLEKNFRQDHGRADI
jgi:hypothetical protein